LEYPDMELIGKGARIADTGVIWHLVISVT